MSFLNTMVDDVPNISVIAKIEVLRFDAPNDAYAVLTDFMDNSNIYGLTDRVVDKTIFLGKNHKIKLPGAIIAATALVNSFALDTTLVLFCQI